MRPKLSKRQRMAGATATHAKWSRTENVRNELERFAPYDGRRPSDALGPHQSQHGSIQSRDARLVNPTTGAELRARYVRTPTSKPNHKRSTPKAGHVLDSMMNATVRGGSLNYR